MVPEVMLLTTPEVAATFRVAESTIRRWEESGDLKGITLPGRGMKRFRKDDIEAILRGEKPAVHA